MSDTEAVAIFRAKESGDVREIPERDLAGIPGYERFTCRSCGRSERLDRMTRRDGVLLCGECK